MDFYIANQVLVFLYACGLGLGLSIVYDIFRILRTIFLKGKIAVFIEDILYFLIVSIALFVFQLTFTEGIIRSYVVIGALLGFVICHLTLGNLLVGIIGFVISKIKCVVVHITAPVFKYSTNLLKGFCAYIKKKVQKHKNTEKDLKNNGNLGYNNNMYKKSIRRGKKMANKRKKGKLKNAVILVAVLAFSAYAIISLSISYSNISNKKIELAQLQSELVDEQNKGKEYDYLLQDNNYKEYVEGAARDAGYVEPQERVFKDVAGQ